MKLRFYARTGNLVPDPRQRQRLPGAPAIFVGRVWDAEAHGYITTKEPAEFDTDMIGEANFQTLRRALVRDRALWCADKATAEYCGDAFVDLVFDEKAALWSPKLPKAEKSGGNS
jgi:hypothetical protein